MGRDLPVDCDRCGEVLDWGDFGPEEGNCTCDDDASTHYLDLSAVTPGQVVWLPAGRVVFVNELPVGSHGVTFRGHPDGTSIISSGGER